MLIVNTDAFTDKNLEKAPATRQNPLEDGIARRLPRLQGRHHRHDAQGDRGPAASNKRTAVAARTSSRSGLVYWLYNRDARAHGRSGSTTSSARSPRSPKPTCARSRPAITTARPPSCSTTATRSAKRQDRSPAAIATSPATRRSASASSPRPSSRGCSCSSAATRSRRRRTSCTARRRYKHFGVTTFQAEDEIAAVCVGDRRRVRAARSRSPPRAAPASRSRPRRSASRS